MRGCLRWVILRSKRYISIWKRLSKLTGGTSPYKIEEFAEAIEKIFGIGAKPLEILIMRRLYEKVEGVVKYNQKKDLVFAEYIAAVKQSFLKKKEQKPI